ncbi:MAG: alpha/beta hydrolase [Nannocystaceae bacterium]
MTGPSTRRHVAPSAPRTGSLTRRRLLAGLPLLPAAGPLSALGCKAIGHEVTPPWYELRYRDDRSADTLLLIAAGATDTPDVLHQHGVFTLLRERGCKSDIVVLYRLAASYVLGDVADDLHADVVAQGERKRRTWLGMSAGGLVTFDYARAYPGEIDRIVALAPFLGPKLVIDEVVAAGSLDRYVPSPPIETIEETWLWLRGYAEGAERPHLDLLWGQQDPGVRALDFLGAALPEAQRFTGPGDHEWPSFMRLLGEYLEAHGKSL